MTDEIAERQSPGAGWAKKETKDDGKHTGDAHLRNAGNDGNGSLKGNQSGRVDGRTNSHKDDHPGVAPE